MVPKIDKIICSADTLDMSVFFNKESKRNPHPNINLGGDEFLSYYRQYMV
jgi:hypothetical protein